MKSQSSRGWIAAAALTLLSLPAWADVQIAGREVRVNQRTDFRQVNPAAAFAPDGRALVVWENDQRGLRGQFLNRDGSAAGAELTLVADDAITQHTQTIQTRRDPSVAFLAGGGFLLAWTEAREDVTSFAFIETRDILDQDVYIQRFDAAGAPAGSRVRVNTTTAAFQRAPQLIQHAGAGPLIAWEGEDGAIRIRPLSAAGALAGQEIRINDAAGAHLAGAAGAKGTLITWEAQDGSDVGVFARLLNAGVQPVGPVFRVNTTTAHRQRRPAVAAGTDGNFMVSWQGDLADGRQSRIFAQAVGAGGNLLGPQLTLVQGFGYDLAQIAPALAPAAGAGHYMLTWLSWQAEGSNGLYMAAAEIDALGNVVGAPTWVTERPLDRNFRNTAIVGDGQGRYLTAWQTVSNLRMVIDARLLGAN